MNLYLTLFIAYNIVLTMIIAILWYEVKYLKEIQRIRGHRLDCMSRLQDSLLGKEE